MEFTQQNYFQAPYSARNQFASCTFSIAFPIIPGTGRKNAQCLSNKRTTTHNPCSYKIFISSYQKIRRHITQDKLCMAKKQLPKTVLRSKYLGM